VSRGLAAPAALAVVLLAGCTPASPPLELSGVLTQADAPPGMSWVASGAQLTAGDDHASLAHEWDESAGSPEECLPMYLVPYGITPADAGSEDRTVEIGYFTHADHEGSVLVNAREYPSEAEAIDYLQHTLESANACPGYTIGEYEVAPDGFGVARFTGGHGLSLDGGQVPGGITAHTAVVRAGRTILVVDAFLLDAADVDPGVVDELARTMLERLDAAD
jgi:hypothetical protein